MSIPRTNPDGSVSLRSAASGPLVTVAGPTQLPSGQDAPALTYYVDFAGAGNDNNDGLTPATPLKTYRYGVSPKLNGKLLPGNVRLYQMSSSPLDDIYWATTFQAGGADANLEVYGELGITQLFEGTITAATNGSVGGRAQFTIAGADLSAYNNKRLRIVAGTNVGAIGWVNGIVSPTTVWTGQPYNPNTGAATGQFRVGDTVVIEELPLLPAWSGQNTQKWEGQNANYFYEVKMGAPGFGGTATYIPSGPTSWDVCEIDTAWLNLSVLTYFSGCRVSVNSGEFTATGYTDFTNCSTNLGLVICQDMEMSRCVQVGRSLVMAGGILRTANYFQFWDWPSGPAVTLLGGSSGSNVSGRLAGTSAAAGTYGMLLRPGTVYSYLAGASNKPSLTGAAAYNVDIAGTQVLWAAVPGTVNAARFAGVVEYNT